MTTRTADQIARSIANWNAGDDTYSPIRNNVERDMIVAALSPPEPTEGQAATGTVHDLKVWPDYFDDVASGKKPFEVRLNDRDFQVGDTLLLREWSHIGDGSIDGKYSGRETRKSITYVLTGAERFGVQDKFVVLGIDSLRAMPLQDHANLADDNERLSGALKSQIEQTWKESDRADKADHMRVAIETGKVHPALAIDVSEHRQQAYQTGWNDGYAEGFGKAKDAKS